MSTESSTYDVIIIGGGVSGIGAACQLRMKLPHMSFVILESRSSLGGTWDFYKYPGVRTDSDMYTMAYSFFPWKDNKTTASASAVNAYLADAANKFHITEQVRFNQKVTKACWSSESATWTVLTEHSSGTKGSVTGSFIFMCAGYTNFNHIHKPEFKDVDKFQGVIAHPQTWPTDLDCKNKRIVVIGSGATAITIIPALAKQAAHVTMLQRSPTYIVQLPNVDAVAAFCARYLPTWLGETIMRVKNIAEQQLVYWASYTFPDFMRWLVLYDLRRQLPAQLDFQKHFTPRYPLLTQRLCLSPDTDFTDAINKYGVSVVTDTVERFTKDGVLLASGEELRADIVVTATGFDLFALGGVQIEIDGVLQENATTSTCYKGVLLCGIPNMVVALGYLTASWTLRVDMIWAYTCRLLAYMQSRGYRSFCPRPPPKDMKISSVFNIFNSTYLNRGKANFFMQGTEYPYSVNTCYYWDYWTFHYGTLHDKWIDIK